MSTKQKRPPKHNYRMHREKGEPVSRLTKLLREQGIDKNFCLFEFPIDDDQYSVNECYTRDNPLRGYKSLVDNFLPKGKPIEKISSTTLSSMSLHELMARRPKRTDSEKENNLWIDYNIKRVIQLITVVYGVDYRTALIRASMLMRQ